MSLADLQSRGLIELLDVELARALGRMPGASSPEQISISTCLYR